MDVAFLLKTWPYLLAAAPGVWTVYKTWNDGRTNTRKDRIDLIRLAQEVAKEAITHLENRIKVLEDELSQLRKEHLDTVTAKDAKILILEGQLRQALAEADAYERLLTANDIAHPKSARPFFALADGTISAMGSSQ